MSGDQLASGRERAAAALRRQLLPHPAAAAGVRRERVLGHRRVHRQQRRHRDHPRQPHLGQRPADRRVVLRQLHQRQEGAGRGPPGPREGRHARGVADAHPWHAVAPRWRQQQPRIAPRDRAAMLRRGGPPDGDDAALGAAAHRRQIPRARAAAARLQHPPAVHGSRERHAPEQGASSIQPARTREGAPAMSHAYIYDHLRTPRGKGKKDGALHQATPVWLLRTLLKELERRNDLDTSLVDDVVLGCVTPIGEQGADIARTAVLDAEWAQTCAGVTQSRFCASGLESVNLAAAKVASGFEDLVVGGGVESMSRWKMGSDGGAWAMDPRVNAKLGFVPQGVGADLIATMEGWNRTDVDTFALNSHKRASAARAEGRFSKAIVPVTDIAG